MTAKPDIDGILAAALKQLPPKPADSDVQAAKKRYSERVSNASEGKQEVVHMSLDWTSFE